MTPQKKTVRVHTLYCLPTPQYIKPSLVPRPLPDFACTLTERDRESSRLKVSTSKQVSAPRPLSSKRFTARTTTAQVTCTVLQIPRTSLAFFFVHDDSSLLLRRGVMHLPSSFCFHDPFWSAYTQNAFRCMLKHHLLATQYWRSSELLANVQADFTVRSITNWLHLHRHVAIITKTSPPFPVCVWEWPGTRLH